MKTNKSSSFPLQLMKFSSLSFLTLFLANQLISYFVTGCSDGALAWHHCGFRGQDVSIEMTLWTLINGAALLLITGMFFSGLIAYGFNKIF